MAPYLALGGAGFRRVMLFRGNRVSRAFAGYLGRFDVGREARDFLDRSCDAA